MGKIIRNGIKYSGSSETANHIIYDNSTSGLDATNVQEAIDEKQDILISGTNIKTINNNSLVGSGNITLTASEVSYDHTTSGLTATNVQDAIDEIDEVVDDAVSKTREINGYDLSEDRTLFVQDIPSKNLLPNTATSQTINGVTFTVNDDGSITVNGTATADTNLFFANDLTIGAGTYIITGCPQGGSVDTFHLNCLVDNSWGDGRDDGNGKQFTASVGVKRAAVTIKAGVVASNLIFYPMIRLASVEDDTYVPYAKTNVELSQGSAGSNYTKLPDGTLIQWGYIINPTPASATGSAWVDSLYFHEYKNPVTFSIPFISNPTLIVSKAAGRTGMVGWSSVSTTEITEIDVVSSQPTPRTGVYLHWVAIGRWK